MLLWLALQKCERMVLRHSNSEQRSVYPLTSSGHLLLSCDAKPWNPVDIGPCWSGEGVGADWFYCYTWHISLYSAKHMATHIVISLVIVFVVKLFWCWLWKFQFVHRFVIFHVYINTLYEFIMFIFLWFKVKSVSIEYNTQREGDTSRSFSSRGGSPHSVIWNQTFVSVKCSLCRNTTTIRM